MYACTRLTVQNIYKYYEMQVQIIQIVNLISFNANFNIIVKIKNHAKYIGKIK